MDKYPNDNDLPNDDLPEEIPPEFLKALDKMLNEPDELPLDPGITKAVIDGIEGYAFKEMLKKIHKKHFNEDGSAKE